MEIDDNENKEENKENNKVKKKREKKENKDKNKKTKSKETRGKSKSKSKNRTKSKANNSKKNIDIKKKEKNYKDTAFYAIDINWFNKWRAFVSNDLTDKIIPNNMKYISDNNSSCLHE